MVHRLYRTEYDAFGAITLCRITLGATVVIYRSKYVPTQWLQWNGGGLSATLRILSSSLLLCSTWIPRPPRHEFRQSHYVGDKPNRPFLVVGFFQSDNKVTGGAAEQSVENKPAAAGPSADAEHTRSRLLMIFLEGERRSGRWVYRVWSQYREQQSCRRRRNCWCYADSGGDIRGYAGVGERTLAHTPSGQKSTFEEYLPYWYCPEEHRIPSLPFFLLLQLLHVPYPAA